MTYEEKKNIVLQMIGLQPSISWYRQCLRVNFTADELIRVEEDEQFKRDVEGCLFVEKQRIMGLRMNAIEKSAAKGDWRGYDKILQEIDSNTFSINKGRKEEEDDTTKDDISFYIPDNGRGDVTE